jgi:hypothetical protein
MKNVLLMFFAVAVLFSSCSKDQKVVKELDGSWIISSRTTDGVAAPSSEINGVTYNFKACKVKDGDCDGSISAPDSSKGTVTYDFKYSISEKGTKFNITISLLGILSETISADIVEHSKSKFVYKFIDQTTTSTGATITTTNIETLTKI